MKRGSIISHLLIAIALIAFAQHHALAQTTYTWATPGSSPAIDNPLNWVGGVAPNFATDATSDSAIFSASTNTNVSLRDATSGDDFSNVTFDSSAPAYTFNSAPLNTVNDLEILPGGAMTNNSSQTQSFVGIPDISINAGTGLPATLNAAQGDPGTHLSYDLTQLKWSSSNTANVANWSSVSGAYDTRTVSVNGVGILQKMGAGTLFVTGDSTPNTARVAIGSANSSDLGPFGAVRISNNNALGSGAVTLYGNANSNGRLELTGNITVNNGINIFGRQDQSASSGGGFPYNNALNPAIVNASGSNTITGAFGISSGGAFYNFASSSGLLTVQSNINFSNSFDRYITFQGNGDGIFTGNLTGSGSNKSVPVSKYGPGTLTLAGTANTHTGIFSVYGGTLALGANATFSFAALAGDSNLPPRVYLANASTTFDVSAVSGGFTLPVTLQGAGNVLGPLTMATGTQVIPGGSPQLQTDGADVIGWTNGIGQMHFHDKLDLSAGSQLDWKLGSLSTSSPGTNFDQITVDGNLVLGGSSSVAIDLSLLSAGQQPGGGDPFWNASHTWTIISNTNNPGSSNFASIVNGVVATGTFTTSVSSGTLLGDVNGDHVVNGLDIAVVASHWLATGATLGQGDANGDGTVNGLDIALIASHWLSTGGAGGSILLTYTPSAGGGTAVPEPSAIALAALSAVGIVAARKCRCRQK